MVRRNTNLPIVFCHVEGQEESAAIATSESNEESKRNMKEVRKAVCTYSTHFSTPTTIHTLLALLVCSVCVDTLLPE